MMKTVTLSAEEVSYLLEAVNRDVRFYGECLPLADKPKEDWWRCPEIVAEFERKLKFCKTLKAKLENSS